MMKTLRPSLFVLILATSTAAFAVRGQGLVSFLNNATTLVSTNNFAGVGPTSPEPKGFYYGLFTAPPNTTDRSLFSFAGIYATNQPVAGRLFGGISVSVPGWAPGEPRAFYVAGWSSNLGHDWLDVKMNLDLGGWTPDAFYGESLIDPFGVPGGPDGVTVLPNLVVFGGSGILPPFVLYTVPEPTSAALVLVGVVLFAFRKR